ncbi:MAG: bifunctional phosphoribosylaminoimidazolecarboxamide formyltransferase/IMP cyclohydrolase [Deinococcota bacterium]
MTRTPVAKTALLSVYDKTGIVDFAKQLDALGYSLISTGGTHKTLTEAGLTVRQVSEVTGSPEILGGRVKTLHPIIHGGILAKRNDEQLAELATHNIATIDVVVVNLYPFRDAVAESPELANALENIDIGGPTMLRAAAKNFPSVLVVSKPEDYADVAIKLGADAVDDAFRRQLAVKAFAHVAAYDAAITRYLSEGDIWQGDEVGLEVHKIQTLRYGENPHQQASLWRLSGERGPVVDAEILQGKAMSFNNYQDADAAWALLSDITTANKTSVVALKHGNPCGVAQAGTLVDAYKKAHDADPLSIFGGIVAVDQVIDADLAQVMTQIFLEIVLAPGYEDGALEVFTAKKNLRLLKVMQNDTSTHNLRMISGGLLVQDRDTHTFADAKQNVVTTQQPQNWDDVEFAWHVVKHAKSNAIVLVKDGVTVGIGSGQVSRIGAAQQALAQASDKAKGAVLASDAFFPFDDVVREAASYGVQTVISPGGSVRDDEVISACNELGVAMVFTGVRHFRH